MAAIKALNISKDYYEYKVFSKGKLLTSALKNISFEVKEGDFFGLLGNNGAGKSTLMKVLTTNITKSSGKAQINGYDLDADVRKIKADISWMFGVDYIGVSWSSIYKNMELAAAFMGIDKKQAKGQIEELLKSFGLWENRDLDVWRMSTGMQGKYALAVAMLKKPKILFLDEPTRGLDVDAKEELNKMLKVLNSQGVTIFYTSHELGEVEKLCKTIMIIDKGEIKYHGDIHDLKAKNKEVNTFFIECTSSDINAILLGIKNTTSFISEYEIYESHENLHKVKIYSPFETSKILVKFAQILERRGVVVEKINAGSLHLEDIFKKILKPEKHKEQMQELKNFDTAKEHPEAVVDYLKDRNHPEVRAAACVTFWNYRREEAESILREMLKRDKQNVAAAIHAIGSIKTPLFNAELKEHAKGEDTDLRRAACVGLAKNGHKDCTESLLDMMLEHETAHDVLIHIKDMHPDVLNDLSKLIHKLPFKKLVFLHHQLQQLPEDERKTILKLLRITHKTYGDWEATAS